MGFLNDDILPVRGCSCSSGSQLIGVPCEVPTIDSQSSQILVGQANRYQGSSESIGIDSHSSFQQCSPVIFLPKTPSIQEAENSGRRPMNLLVQVSGETVILTRQESTWVALNCEHLKSQFPRIFRPDGNGNDFFRLVSLPDSANAYASIASVQPKSVCKLTKINLRFVRDSLANGVLSFVGAGANLADTLTKVRGDIEIFYHFGTAGYFSVSFLGREGARILRKMRT